MYKLCYYRFSEIQTSYNAPNGYDTVRNQAVGVKNIKLKHFKEAFTSDKWIVRIYSVNPPKNREPGIKSRFDLKSKESKLPQVRTLLTKLNA